MLLLTSYLDPDLDGTACAIAYAELLNAQNQQATAVLFGTPSKEARWVAQELHLTLPGPIPLQNAKVILVDASDRNSLEIQGLDPSQITEIIDHRQTHETEIFGNAKIQIELVGSCATLIAEKFATAKIEPTPISAALLSLAIASNTLNFLSRNTTIRDRAAFSWLSRVASLPQDFVRNMFRAKSDLSGDKLRERLENEYARVEYNGKKILFAQLELINIGELSRTRSEEILSELKHMAGQFGSDYYLCSLVELDPDYSSNIFITDQPASQKILSQALGVEFGTDHTALRTGLMMRKEILPLLKSCL